MKLDQILKIVQFFHDNEDLSTTNLSLNYSLDTNEYELLDRELYVRQNNKISGYVKNPTIELILGRLKFIFKENIV